MHSSFRDPDGRVVLLGGRILRLVRPSISPGTIDFVRLEHFAGLVEDGLFVPTTFLGDSHTQPTLQTTDPSLASLFSDDEQFLVFEHERVLFPSYPYEWPLEMLHAAGKLTLDLAQRLLPIGFGLKDATPYNVLFRGPRPVFVDLLSFERREPCDPTWLPYGQFVRTFVRPLLVNTWLGLGTREILTVHRDGLNAADVNRLFTAGQKLRPTPLKLITLPALLGRLRSAKTPSIYRPNRVSSPEKASFILDRQLKSLRKTLDKVGTRRLRQSVWSNYVDGAHHSPDYFESKRHFVERALTDERPTAGLDVGCNRGDFSAIRSEER